MIFLERVVIFWGVSLSIAHFYKFQTKSVFVIQFEINAVSLLDLKKVKKGGA